MGSGRASTIKIGGTESPSNDPVRAVLGVVTPQGKALTDILASYEPELSAFLQDPKNREALANDPLRALSSVLPDAVVKSLGQPVKLPPQLQEKLQKLPLHTGVQLQSPAIDLYQKAWAQVSTSAANFATFSADMKGTLRQIDPNAITQVVEQVVAAFDTVRGIQELDTGIDPGYFSSQVQATLEEGQTQIVKWPL